MADPRPIGGGPGGSGGSLPPDPTPGTDLGQLKFRDPARARALAAALEREVALLGRPVTAMHVCGSHEQAIARFGLRAVLPRGLRVVMGPGCPVCVTDAPEVDAAVALALAGCRVATYGDMLRVRGTRRSLADARAEGAPVEVIYGAEQAVALAAARPAEQVVFFASGFETTAVTTAAVLAAGVPANFSVLSAHKYIPPAMEAVASLPDSRIDGYLAAGHAAAITGWAVFEPFARRHRAPVVVAGFEPLDILAALVKLLELLRQGRAEVANAYPRVVTREGNRAAQARLWEVFETADGAWRGLPTIASGDLRLRAAFAAADARRRFAAALPPPSGPGAAARGCLCGDIMIGRRQPTDCALFGRACTPETPAGACMVSAEGACRIWHTYGGVPDLAEAP